MICGGECGTFNPLILECLMDISESLKNDLQSNVQSMQYKREFQSITDEIINNNDLAASGQMLQQIEFERAKSEFYETEIYGDFFSFRTNPSTLTLSDTIAQKLGLNRIIPEPLENEDVKNAQNESCKQLIEKILAATPENPMVIFAGNIGTKGAELGCEIRCRTMWTNAENPVFLGVAGKIEFR